MLNLTILPTGLLEQYKKSFNKKLHQVFDQLHDSDLSVASFSFYTSVAAVFSSKIEGENIELDSFIKHKRFGAEYQPDYTRKIDDLYEAYLFARQNNLTVQSLLQTHALLTRHILQQSKQGKFRTGNMFVVANDGGIEYVAADPAIVKKEMEKLGADIEKLLAAKMNFYEVLFFASMLHLVFVKIHLFEDGNGRTARLLEKWFIAEKLGARAWYIQSEKKYYDQHDAYYHNIRKLGAEYEHLNYDEALPFLQMLPGALSADE